MLEWQFPFSHMTISDIMGKSRKEPRCPPSNMSVLQVAKGYKFIILCLKGVKYCMKVYQTSKLRVHRVNWPALVRLAALKQPCRTMGTFVVLDSGVASPAASRQELLHMWTIALTIHGSIEHLYLWVCIVKAPWSWGQGHQGAMGPIHGCSPQCAAWWPPSHCRSHELDGSTGEERQIQMCLPSSIGSRLVTRDP